MSASSFLADLIKNISVDDYRELKLEAKKHSTNSWINTHKTKAATIGAATGLFGGPISMLLEGADIAYLGRIIGRLCFGIGHIKNKSVDYNSDLDGILALWTDIATPMSRGTLKQKFRSKFRFEISEEYNKYLENLNINKKQNESFFKRLFYVIFFFFKKQSTIQNNEIEKELLSFEEFEETLFKQYLSEITIKNKIIIDDSSDTFDNYLREAIFTLRISKKFNGNLGAKMLGKKGMPKLVSKILSKASGKLGSKLGAKMSTKWIPFVGSATSAGINTWIVDNISEAAVKYYRADYIRIKSDMSEDFLSDMNSKLLDSVI
jgi:hypothetical protein